MRWVKLHRGTRRDSGLLRVIVPNPASFALVAAVGTVFTAAYSTCSCLGSDGRRSGDALPGGLKQPRIGRNGKV